MYAKGQYVMVKMEFSFVNTQKCIPGLIFSKTFCKLVPAGLAYGQEHQEIAVENDSQRNEENKAAQHHRVAPIGQCVCDIIPCARCHQALRNVGA